MNLPGLCQSCAARDVDCVNEAISIEMTSNKDGVIECSRYKFKEATVSDNYCGECEHQPDFAKECRNWCITGDMFAGSNHPACAVFSEKKRGICKHPLSICSKVPIVVPEYCDSDCMYNFKEAL